MAAVTWKNIAPSNPSGILNAANQAARGMSEGLGTIGEKKLDVNTIYRFSFGCPILNKLMFRPN